MVIIDIRNLMTQGIGSISDRVRNIGRNINKTESKTRSHINNKFGLNISRRNLAVSIGFISSIVAGATLLTRYSDKKWKDNRIQGLKKNKVIL